ncbi:MAG: nicotinamide mononucleotide transporter [Muribaculaceae bacterium]|nr:nicotinamide mononucleotide transporter [Muribaculaceae bacterium]
MEEFFNPIAQLLATHGETITLLDAVGTVLGLVYLWLEYKANIWMWVVGIIMPVIDIFLYFKTGLYADFGMAIYYSLAAIVAACYGMVAWRRGDPRTAKPERPITHLPAREALLALGAFLVIWAVMYEMLIHLTDSTVPITDSFANALSIIALWALARKYVEQWLLWLVADAVLTALYAYKGLVFRPCLYGFYTVMAVVGWRKWRQMAAQVADVADND